MGKRKVVLRLGSTRNLSAVRVTRERERHAKRARGCECFGIVRKKKMRHHAHLTQTQRVIRDAIRPIDATHGERAATALHFNAFIHQHRDAYRARGCNNFARRVEMIMIAEHHKNAERRLKLREFREQESAIIRMEIDEIACERDKVWLGRIRGDHCFANAFARGKMTEVKIREMRDLQAIKRERPVDMSYGDLREFNRLTKMSRAQTTTGESIGNDCEERVSDARAEKLRWMTIHDALRIARTRRRRCLADCR